MTTTTTLWDRWERVLWDRTHYVQNETWTTSEAWIALVWSLALALLIAAFFLQLGRFIHLLTYRPHRGDITVHRGVATLHV